ncbi:MAG: putative lipid II flippase FtsW [Acidimicrobiia bacterium]|nr:putative lipid II flippase FtsW [Acidimicrobiia bacterium]MYC56983.1 putative lipid II flippase FtsW [Acidimicrobiia bacterium]MYG94085.1 putative lipid II flippase FtsW [Acidimicrobiia bacterium]MYI30848.1 putative lipid II flippase FtsW [Acidimicrobiia bacterium]
MTVVSIPRRPLARMGRFSGLLAAPVGRATVPFYLLFGFVTTLTAVGLVMVLSVSSVTSLYVGQSTFFTFQRQLVWMLVGLLVLVTMMRFDYNGLKKYSLVLLSLSLILLVAVLVPGVGVAANGATRWIAVGPINFQPSELAKLAMVVFAASWLADKVGSEHSARVTIHPVLLVCCVMSALILVQRSLATPILVAVIAFAALYIAGAPLIPLTGWSLLSSAAAALVAWQTGYRRERIQAMWDPWSDPLDAGWQTIQARVGISSGGISGLGLGESRIKWGFLPEAQTDFIYAVLAEEMGWLGAMFVLVLFAGFIYCGIWVALHSGDRFGQVLAAGITVWIGSQAFLNIAAVVGWVPVTGVPLPFLSVGGSSLITSMAASGILLNVARQIRVQ